MSRNGNQTRNPTGRREDRSGRPADARADAGRELRRAADALEADVFFLSGDLDRTALAALRKEQEQSDGRNRCVLVLTTPGGDPHAAYLLARFLRRAYDHVTTCVFGYCKSAGTLLALGGHTIAIGERGELGPLDVQVRKEDELARFGSGLEIFMSLDLLMLHAFRGFERSFFATVDRTDGSITSKTAAEIATRLTVGIVKPIAQQIDPLRLGLERRALQIARAYAERLGETPQVIARLTDTYPSHGFVIDREEAVDLLTNARRATDAESRLERAVTKAGLDPYSPATRAVRCLNPRQKSDSAQPDAEENSQDEHNEERVLGSGKRNSPQAVERDSGVPEEDGGSLSPSFPRAG